MTLARPYANHVALLRVRSLAGHDTANAARYKVDLTFLQCKSESDFIKVGECPLDPGGYFIIKVWPVVEGRTMAGAADSLFPGYREGHHVAGAAQQKPNHH